MPLAKRMSIHMCTEKSEKSQNQKYQNGESFLALFQLTDSFFPTGAFAHSFGLETYVQQGLVKDAATLEELLSSSLRYGIRNTDAIAMALAYKAAQKRNLDQLIDLDMHLTALKLPRESRQGSIQIGKQLLRNFRSLLEDETLKAYADLIQSGRCVGHHAIVYGLVTAAASIDMHLALLGYLHIYVVGQVSAAVRLIPLGGTEGQMIIQRIRPELLEIVEFALQADMEDLGSFTPALDIRSMQHERLYSRLFIS